MAKPSGNENASIAPAGGAGAASCLWDWLDVEKRNRPFTATGYGNKRRLIPWLWKARGAFAVSGQRVQCCAGEQRRRFRGASANPLVAARDLLFSHKTSDRYLAHARLSIIPCSPALPNPDCESPIGARSWGGAKRVRHGNARGRLRAQRALIGIEIGKPIQAPMQHNCLAIPRSTLQGEESLGSFNRIPVKTRRRREARSASTLGHVEAV
jgi:hypothetical protein